MKNRILFGVVLLILLVGAGAWWHCVHTQKLEIHPEITRATIYADTSSFPTLLQMVDLVKSDPAIPKLIFWRRMMTLDAEDPILQQAQIVPVKKYKFTGTDFTNLRDHIQRFVNTYPNAKFTVHVNMDQNPLVWTVLTAIPRDRIEHIHWYEESFGSCTFQLGQIRVPPEHALRLLERKTPPPHFGFNYSRSLLPFYPSTVYIGMADYVMKEYPQQRRALEKAQKIEDVNFERIANSLTKEQKQNLLRLGGISEKDLSYFNQNKPVLLYTLGFLGEENQLNLAQIQVLDDLLSGKIVPLGEPDQYVWLFKEHPWITKNTFLRDQIIKKYPYMHPLPKQVPLELLFLAGYMPDKVFGYSSSLFFALPKERILFYIPRLNDPYLPLLKKINKITDHQIWQISHYRSPS